MGSMQFIAWCQLMRVNGNEDWPIDPAALSEHGSTFTGRARALTISVCTFGWRVIMRNVADVGQHFLQVLNLLQPFENSAEPITEPVSRFAARNEGEKPSLYESIGVYRRRSTCAR